MTDVESAKGLDDFIASGRTGRRNALPDILDEKVAATSTGSLPFELEKMKCSDNDEASKSDTACGGTGDSNTGGASGGDKSS